MLTRHGHPHELVLSSATAAARGASLVEHLERLHGGRRAHTTSAGLLTLAPRATAAEEVLVLADSIFLVNVLILQLLVLAGKIGQGVVEHAGVAAVSGVSSGFLFGA